MTRSPGLVLALVAALGLSACGGSDSSSSSPPSGAGLRDSASYFPLEIGNRWLYDVTTTTPDVADTPVSRELVHISGNTTVDGQDALLVRTLGLAEGAVPTEARLLKTGTALQQRYDSSDGPFYATVAQDSLLRLPLRLGESYVATNVRERELPGDYDGDGQNEHVSLRRTVTVKDIGTVTVPAGTYNNALKIVTRLRVTLDFSRDGPQTAETETEAWYVAHVGLVKSRTVDTTSGRVELRELRGHTIAGVSSDATAPALVAPLPADGSVTSDSSNVALRFDEDMDPDAFTSATLTLLNTNLQISSDVVYGDRRLRFVIPGGLPDGSYTATLGGATDALGNPLPGLPYTWSFAIDGDVPSVMVTAPDHNARFVATNSDIRLTFSEAIAAGSVSGDSIVLSHGSGVQAATYSVSDNMVTVHPAAPLTKNTVYTVTVNSGVKDVEGSAVATPYAVSFTTVPPYFSSYISLGLGSTPEAVAIGDVDGDGLADVALTTSYIGNPGSDHQLYLFLQQADGSLTATSYSLAGGPACPAMSLAIGDVDGDGLNDVAVAERGCGIELFTHKPNGKLFSSGTLTTSDSSSVRIADVNADGRRDLVAAGSGSSVSVWYQKTAGGLGNIGSYAMATNGVANEVEVGDLDGNGLADLVVAQGSAVAVLPQTGPGSFGTMATHTSPDNSVEGIALADANGDGRLDLLWSGYAGVPASQLNVRHQQADGSLGGAVALAAHDGAGAVVAADIDGNGRSDAVVFHPQFSRFGLFRQGSNGVLENELLTPVPQSSNIRYDALAVGDINGDGRADAVIAAYDGLSNQLLVLYNAGP